MRTPVARIERLIHQRDEMNALFTQAIENFARPLFDGESSPMSLATYHNLVQRQALIVNPNGKGRANLARNIIKGSGVEIGGLHCPLLLPENASVRYVDAHPHKHLRKEYSELKEFLLVIPEVIAQGELLEPLEDRSLDFIIANHMIEHSKNPIQVLFTFSKKLRPGGVVFLAVPDKRATFDKNRALTSTEHVMADFKDPTGARHDDHVRDLGRNAAGLKGEALEKYVANFDSDLGDIHYHVWTPATFGALLKESEKLEDWPYSSSMVHEFADEFIAILVRA